MTVVGEAHGSGVIGPTVQRWWVLAAFASLTMLNALMWITFAPTRAACALFFAVDGDTIDWLSMSYMVVYPVAFALPTWYLEGDGKSLQRGLRLCALLNVVGAVLRFASTYSHSFPLLMSGQVILAIAQCLSLGVPPRVAALWFGESEWGFATGLGVLANQFGPVVAYLVIPSLVTEDGVGLPLVLALESVFAVASTVLTFLAVPQHPTRPPSRAAASRTDIETTFWEFCKSSLSMCRRDSLLQGMGYGVVVGVLYAFETLLDILLPSLSSQRLSVLGTTALISGLPGSLFGGWVLDVTKQYKWATIALTLAPGLTLIGVTMLSAVADQHFVVVLALCSVAACLLCAVLSAGFEWAVELSYPTSESTSAAVLNCWANIFGIVFIYGIEAVVQKRSCVFGNGLLVLGLLSAVALLAVVSDRRNRQDLNPAALKLLG